MTECRDVNVLLGAYAIGALDPEDAQRVRAHLETCASCRLEVSELAETADALALLDLADVVEPVEAPAIDGLLDRVRAYRRRRRFATLAVAAAVAVAAGVGGGLVAGGDEAPEVQPPVASVSGEEAGVALAVEAWDKGWGTALRAEISGVPGGSRCSLVAVGQDGSREIAASWVVPGAGYGGPGQSLIVDGAVGLRSGDVDHYAVVTADGTTLVSVPAVSPR